MERNENKSKLNVSELKCETSILFVMCVCMFIKMFVFYSSSSSSFISHEAHVDK